jgi:hypothetical protein
MTILGIFSAICGNLSPHKTRLATFSMQDGVCYQTFTRTPQGGALVTQITLALIGR